MMEIVSAEGPDYMIERAAKHICYSLHTIEVLSRELMEF